MRIKRFWKYLSSRGFKETMTLSEQKKLLLTNQISILLFAILFLLMLAVTIISGKINVVSFLVCLLILTIPILNHNGLYRLTSFMMSVVFPVNVLIFSTFSKIQVAETGTLDIVYHFTPRFLFLGGLILPLVLIDVKHKWILATALLVNFACMFLYDPVCHYFGVGIMDLSIGFDKYSFITWFMILPWMLILFGFLFLQSINNNYEKKVLSLNRDLSEKNSKLNLQNEEIMAQRDEISSQRDEITAQRDAITQQKDQIEFIHEEQTSSIRYAQRIQQAMLPSLDLIKDAGFDHFLFFKPRDIVSGDFYWAGRQENTIVITVADCTGHGVPGAFMSMLGIAFLKEIVMKEYITQPDVILKKLRKEIVRSLKQNDESTQRDGMDIALCSINLDTLELQFAGANNPFYIVKAEAKAEAEEVKREETLALASSLALFEVKGDKMPIGIHERMDAFSLYTHQLQKGDCIYLFSDGFADQFGGRHGKKLKYKQLKEILLTNSGYPLTLQKEKIEMFFSEWKGSLEQVDDVTLLGIKL